MDWHEVTWTFSPLGYRPAGAPGTIVPGYPLGLPLVMAAARRVIGEFGPYLVGPALAVLAAFARLRALGRRPILVVEDWEKPALRARFPSGGIASLDWPPRAEAGGTTRVGVWDPADRGLPAASIATDRLP